jgi:hypothetical protein
MSAADAAALASARAAGGFWRAFGLGSVAIIILVFDRDSLLRRAAKAPSEERLP